MWNGERHTGYPVTDGLQGVDVSFELKLDFPARLVQGLHGTFSDSNGGRTISMSTSNASDYSQAEVNMALTPEAKVLLLREMQRIRAFEIVTLQHYQTGFMGRAYA